TRLAQPSQLHRFSARDRCGSGGKPFALNKTFLEVLVVETYPLGSRKKFWHAAREHVSARNKRIKDGKQHRYYTVVESRRLRSGKVAQRQVLYLGEIND